MREKFSDLREKLRPAISSGAFAKADSLDKIRVKTFGFKSSLNVVELLMSLEEQGTKLDTIDDLMGWLDQAVAD